MNRIALVSVLLAAGCSSSSKLYALVSVTTSSGELDVAKLSVQVQNGSFVETLTYPVPGAALKLNETMAVSFSVGYGNGHRGQLQVRVTALGTDDLPSGYGEGMAAIRSEHVTEVAVQVTPGRLPPGRTDGGVRVDAPTLACEPTAPAAKCGGGETCSVGCRVDGTPTGRCTMAGPKKPGEACSETVRCEPGSQCLDYGCNGVQLCRNFCNNDSDCGQGKCATNLPCMKNPTGFRICTQPCDPTGTATDGCAAGLSCFLFEGETTTCECRAASRIGGDAAECADTEDCQPGFVCVRMGARRACRALCKLAAPSCTSGTCTKLVDPDFKVYGGCLP